MCPPLLHLQVFYRAGQSVFLSRFSDAFAVELSVFGIGYELALYCFFVPLEIEIHRSLYSLVKYITVSPVAKNTQAPKKR